MAIPLYISNHTDMTDSQRSVTKSMLIKHGDYERCMIKVQTFCIVECLHHFSLEGLQLDVAFLIGEGT